MQLLRFKPWKDPIKELEDKLASIEVLKARIEMVKREAMIRDDAVVYNAMSFLQHQMKELKL